MEGLKNVTIYYLCACVGWSLSAPPPFYSLSLFWDLVFLKVWWHPVTIGNNRCWNDSQISVLAVGESTFKISCYLELQWNNLWFADNSFLLRTAGQSSKPHWKGQVWCSLKTRSDLYLSYKYSWIAQTHFSMFSSPPEVTLLVVCGQNAGCHFHEMIVILHLNAGNTGAVYEK